jgi:hypothetical protein
MEHDETRPPPTALPRQDALLSNVFAPYLTSKNHLIFPRHLTISVSRTVRMSCEQPDLATNSAKMFR